MSTHETALAPAHVKPPSEREFGLVLGAVLAVIALVPLIYGHPYRAWALALGLALIVSGLLAPTVLKPFNWLWFQLGLVMNRIMSPIVLGILFYGLITPMGMLMRLFGYNPLRLKPDKAAPSYWINRDPAKHPGKGMKNQF